jgi:hypothetical protein
MVDINIKKMERELKALEELEKREERRKRRKADWEVPGERARYLRERRKEQREKMLNDLCPTRVCPLCKRTRARSRSWVIVTWVELKGALAKVMDPKPKVAICRSCAMKGGYSWSKK